MRAIVSTVLMVVVGAVVLGRLDWGPPAARQAPAADLPAPTAPERVTTDSGAEAARQAFAEQARGRQLEVTGTVVRTLADDRDGSPHQRFIIRTEAGQTLLVAHNLDLAPRLDGLQTGDTVRIYGEFEWNPQGGVMHWTHHDPRGVHPAGYIDWRGRRFQ